MTPNQQLILVTLRDFGSTWSTRKDIEGVTGRRKGYAKAMGAPTTGIIKPGSLEGLGYVERPGGAVTIPLEYRITPKGRAALKNSSD